MGYSQIISTLDMNKLLLPNHLMSEKGCGDFLFLYCHSCCTTSKTLWILRVTDTIPLVQSVLQRAQQVRPSVLVSASLCWWERRAAIVRGRCLSPPSHSISGSSSLSLPAHVPAGSWFCVHVSSLSMSCRPHLTSCVLRFTQIPLLCRNLNAQNPEKPFVSSKPSPSLPLERPHYKYCSLEHLLLLTGETEKTILRDAISHKMYQL